MSEREIIAVRDPFGFRPLSLGKLDGAYILHVGTTSHQLIRRGDTLAIRSRDPHNPLRRTFPGSEWFPR